MKKLLLLLALIIPMMANAMKIDTDEVDEFTGKRTVRTSWESVNNGYIHIRFRLQAEKTFIDFKFITDNSIVIAQGDKLMFKSTTDNIAEFASVRMFHGGLGDGAVGLPGSKAWGISASYSGTLSWFATNQAKLLRVYATDGYYDKKLSEADGKKLQKLYGIFSSTINGEVGTKVFANYMLTFVKRRAKSNGGWDKIKEEYKKDLSKEELMEIVNEWKSQSNDQYEYDVMMKKEK